jgi:Bacterial Ig-like domain (group 2)
VTISPHGTKLVKLDEMQYAPSSQGGITVSYRGAENALLINGGLQDSSNGYSATLRFVPAVALQSPAPAQGYAELGLMAGAPDPMMAFPAGTVFTPYSIVRNITDQSIGITPVLWWMEAGAPRSTRLREFDLSARSTQRLSVESLLAQAGLKTFSGNFNLILEADARHGGLLMSSGSVDQSNTYVFEVIPQGVGNSVSKALSYWSTGKGDDTMVTIWNPADEAQNFVFTLFFSGGSYKYPIALGPRATETFNVSEIIHNQLPDADGKVIPSTVHDGSAEIAGTRGEAEEILVEISAGIYNVQKATCGDPCNVCNGITDTFIQINPFSQKVGATTTESFIAQFNTGSNQDLSSRSTWSSSDTTVATVKNPGTVTGVKGGTFYASANTNPETFFLYNRVSFR